VNTRWRNWVFLNGTGGSSEGEQMCRMTQDHACVFLRSQAVISLWSHLTWANSESTVLFGSIDKVTEICSEKKERTLAWQVDSARWQRPCVWCVMSMRVPGEEIHYKNWPSTLFILVPSNFWFFQKWNNKVLRRQRLSYISDIQRNAKDSARYSGTRFSRLSGSGNILSRSA
jgi:hypothetical protein